MTKRINFEYLKLSKEIPLFALSFWFIQRNKKIKNDKILLVNTCLIGEFIVSVPAIADFIDRNKNKCVDLVVSPQQKDLARRINGVGSIFTAKSVFERKAENCGTVPQKFSEYEKMIILRISPDAYSTIKKIRAGKVETGFWTFIKYSSHIFFSVVFRKTPRQWRTIIFKTLGGEYKTMPFESLFKFEKKDYEKIRSLNFLETKNKKILIHFGTNWPMKKWDNCKWINLLNRINAYGDFIFIFIGNGNDAYDFEIISKKLYFKPHSLINKLSLTELILLMRLADYFIGIDSGPGNMAHIADLRSIVIFGPGPHIYLPVDKSDIAIDKSNGRGLYQMYFMKKNGFIHQISAEEVFEAFKKISKIA